MDLRFDALETIKAIKHKEKAPTHSIKLTGQTNRGGTCINKAGFYALVFLCRSIVQELQAPKTAPEY